MTQNAGPEDPKTAHLSEIRWLQKKLCIYTQSSECNLKQEDFIRFL